VGSIGVNPNPRVEVGVATSNGKAYYEIITFLKTIGVFHRDVILTSEEVGFAPLNAEDSSSQLIITTRKERLLIPHSKVICIEDLGDDPAVAKQRFFSAMYPTKSTDVFLIGIDPGERTGVAAFVNHRELESLVLRSVHDTIARVTKLLENAPQSRKIVRIGFGNPKAASELARRLQSAYHGEIRIQFVDERGTSTLVSAGRKRRKSGTRDQRAAKLIAFREGQEFQPDEIRVN
jgi:RNase H-fold protein (predicted Holliday junction resolvase)